MTGLPSNWLSTAPRWRLRRANRARAATIERVTPVLPNVLAARYASGDMTAVWSPERKVVLERELWIAVMEAQRELGVDIPADVIADYRAAVDKIDLASIEARERVTRHDVKARIEEFSALAGHEQAHLGMTSRDVTENVEQLQVRSALQLVRGRMVATLARLAERAAEYSTLVTAGRTHNVAAQATTLGKRFANAGEELLQALARIDDLLARYPLRGIKGPVGTQQDQLDLLGDPDAVARLDQAVRRHLGFEAGLGAGASGVAPKARRNFGRQVVALLIGGEPLGPYIGREGTERVGGRRVEIGIAPHELGLHLRLEAQDVVIHQNLAVAARSRADADGGYVDGVGDHA